MRLLIWMCLVVFVGGARAQAAELFDDYRFAAPAAWVRLEQNGVVFFHPRDLRSGEVVLFALNRSQPLEGDFRAWYDARLTQVHRSIEVVNASGVTSSKAAGDGAARLSSSVTVREARGVVQHRVYHGAQLGSRVVLVSLIASSQELSRQYRSAFDALTNSLALEATTGNAAAAASTSSAPSGAQASTLAALPALDAPTYADFQRLRLDPTIDPVPDEFRCYLSRRGDDYSRPAFAFQILPGGQYRTPVGIGSYAPKTGSYSLRYVSWKSGPFARSQDAHILWDDFGQRITLDGIGKDEMRLFCYQRGAREQRALLQFRRMDPQPGSYPCTRTDGSNQAGGTLEILAARRYRMNGVEGAYRADILGRQREDNSDVDFASGPLADRSAFYSEDDAGERSLRFYGRGKMECKVVVEPTRPAKFGTAKAPPPPQPGGVEGAFARWRPDPLAMTTPTCGGLCWDIYIFDRSGYVFDGEPDEGNEQADCTRTKPNGFPVCKPYRVEGDRLVIGDDKPVPFQRTANGLKVDGNDMVRLQKVDGLKPSGTYRAFSASTTTVGGSGGMFSETLFSFAPDGRFSRDASGGFSFTGTDTGTPTGNVTSGVTATSQRATGGTYRFHDNTLELRYSDGRVVRLFAFVGERDNRGRPNMLRLGGRDYVLQEK